MDEPPIDKPSPISFIATKKICNSNILYQLNSTQATAWLKNPKVQKAFLLTYSSNANIHTKLFHVITEFVPKSFNAGTAHSHTMLEANNSLTPDSITWMKYIKPLHPQTMKQQSAHVIIGLSNREDANKIILHGLYIEDKHTNFCKMTVTPRRCLKCQHFGHYASECKATTDMCVLCTLNHCTNLCPTPDSPPKCANCTGISAVGHGSADKDCPSFLSETHKLH